MTTGYTDVSLSTGGGTTSDVNVAQFGGNAVVTGTGVSGAGIPRVTVSSDSFPATQPVSGTVAVTQSTSPWVENVSQFGGTNVSTGTGNGGAGIPRVTVSSDSSLTNISGTISLPTLASTSTKQSDGSQKSQVVDGANATVGPVQTLSGTNYLPVVLASSATAGSAVPARSVLVSGSDGTNARNISTDTAGVVNVNATVTSTRADSAPATQNVTAQDTASTTTAVANGQNFITGTATANSTASFALTSFESVEVQVTGTWTGTLSSEISLDGGTTWFTRGVKQAGASYLASTFTANFSGGLNVSGMTNYRIRSTAAWTGTATVKIVASVNGGSITVTNPMTLRDATTQSIMSTVKAASTASVATDTALVVALSPNSNMVSLTPTTTGGTSVSRLLSAASTNSTSVKGSAGQVYGWYITNTNSVAKFVKLYNKATAPTVGTDTPFMTLVIPGNSNGAGTNLYIGAGVAFGTGIGFAITGAVTDADTTAVAANEVVVNLFYK